MMGTYIWVIVKKGVALPRRREGSPLKKALGALQASLFHPF